MRDVETETIWGSSYAEAQSAWTLNSAICDLFGSPEPLELKYTLGTQTQFTSSDLLEITHGFPHGKDLFIFFFTQIQKLTIYYPLFGNQPTNKKW